MSCPEVGGLELAMGAWRSKRHLIGEPRKKMAKDTIEPRKEMGSCQQLIFQLFEIRSFF